MRRRAVAAATLLALGAGAIGAVWPAQPARGRTAEVVTDPVRILVLGDSIAHGWVGDHTWRYRLWRALQSAGALVDFVGPHTGLFDPATLEYDAPGYADPGFDQDHAARWGGSMTIPEFVPASLVAAHRPDVVVNALGVNDLGVFEQSAGQLLDRVRSFVAEVRSVNPEVAVVLTQLPEWWTPNADAYNAGLVVLAAELDESGSRVIAAPAPA